MRYLLDVNVLIALCDELHAHHRDAHRWFTSEGNQSWATCPLTENAFIRITSKPSYPRSTGSVTEQLKVLRELCQIPGHQFWPDEVSLLRQEIWSNMDLTNPADLTDLYLIALAIKRGAKFATLEHTIPAHRIRGGKEALFILPA
jgi:toxin-antitoxin system PIN domain toxin